MAHLIFIFLLILATLNFCWTLPYKSQIFAQEHEDRRNFNNYNFEDQPEHNCQHQHRHHQNHNHLHNFDVAEFQRSFHNPLWNRLFPIPQDLYHRLEIPINTINNKRTVTHFQQKQNEIYADINAAETEEEENVEFEPRTILDAPKNCKQTNFKGKCIKY